MLVIGMANDIWLSSAAIVRDGEVIGAIAEERLNRQKLYKGFPALAMKECLKLAGATIQDVDHIVIGWNPARHMEFHNYRASNNSRWRPEVLYGVPNMILGHTGTKSGEWVDTRMDNLGPRIVYYDHHLCHAANAFYLSGWQDAAFFTADGRGERSGTSWGVGNKDGGLKQLGEVRLPHSLGLFYGAITQFLGFTPSSDEWKVMALASYGKPDNEFYNLLRPLITVDRKRMQFYIDQRMFSFSHLEYSGGKYYTDYFAEVFGTPRKRDGEYEQRHKDLAWAMQRVFEEVMTEMLTELHARTGQKRVVMAGGCMMNSVFNGKVSQVTPFEDVFISSCPDDSGIAVGAALLGYYTQAEKPVFKKHEHNYWGPSFDDQILPALKGYKLKYTKLENPAKAAADLLTEGMLVGWYQGRMEFGQRALGNRSILGDPRREDIKDIVNSAVKFREGFRPFAPAILAHKVGDWFEDSSQKVPFMERVLLFKDEVKSKVPGVVHADGSGRLQTVEREHNGRFFDLITEFEKNTGVPIVLNTSFNLNGEPIVCTPNDAIRTFFSCGLDVLIIGDYMLRK